MHSRVDIICRQTDGTNISTLFDLRHQPFLPANRHVIDILSRVLLVGVSAVAAVVGGAGGSAVVDLVGGGLLRQGRQWCGG